ncbi:MAG: 30S ribosomal protein S12 methylthiotransferase RimO [Candidatus Omnitrophota bacterium]|jgi:ribosomal protein S12 methylthiotransferase
MLKAGIYSLGCPRNLVDSEIIAGSLKSNGFTICEAEDGVDICVINTCAFIESAREESVDKIIEAARLKKEGKIKYLVVCGCLPQLYKKKLAKQLNEVDLLLGTSDFKDLPGLIKRLGTGPTRTQIGRSLKYIYDELDPRLVLTPRHYAYVKISEGCSNACSYCIISRLRGQFRSRPITSIVNEVRELSGSGVLKEINLIGQDTTFFGHDQYGKPELAQLLESISHLDNSPRWIRVLYTHPKHYTDDLIATIHREGKICKYLDIPIQHISDGILKKMNRGVNRRDIEILIEKIRERIPGVVLRTSVIVGFPGERDKDFNELLKFISKAKFERLGAFTYSKEDGTPAAKFKGQVEGKIKSERFDILMKLQQSISEKILRKSIGRTLEVLIDEKCEDARNKFVGRTRGDAPDIDGVVYVSGRNIKVGEFYDVMITDSVEYDLIGEKV